MMDAGDDEAACWDARLLAENEQLRTALENALENNAQLAEDRDRLLRRVATFAGELKAAHVRRSAEVPEGGTIFPSAQARDSETEEELRVAFEELQVVTEELEVANASLQQVNGELDSRVQDRTRKLNDANAALRSVEVSFRALADLVPDLLWRTDAEGSATWFNQRWFAQTGQVEQEALAFGWFEAVHPIDRPAVRADWARAVGLGEPYQREQRILDRTGTPRWFLIRAEPVRGAYGSVLHWFAAGTDIHEQRLALETLQRTELRFRTLVEGMPQLVWRAVDAGKWTWSSPQWTAYTGQSDPEALGMGWLLAFHPDDREPARVAWLRAQFTGSLDLESRIFNIADQSFRHFRTRALPVREADGRVIEWLGTSTDVHDMLQLQEQQSVLIAELQHRTRNLMAVVRSVMQRTLRGTGSLDEFRPRIEHRLAALARAQGLLSRRPTGARVAFDELVREELAAHVDLESEAGKVSLAGPPGVPLRSAIVQTLSLALHELATNAIKYGALSRAGGHLAIEWRERCEGGERRLHVDWRESGVADMPVTGTAPRGGGYGRELIERALPYQLGARTSYVFEPDGVHCTIDIAVPRDDPQANSCS